MDGITRGRFGNGSGKPENSGTGVLKAKLFCGSPSRSVCRAETPGSPLDLLTSCRCCRPFPCLQFPPCALAPVSGLVPAGRQQSLSVFLRDRSCTVCRPCPTALRCANGCPHRHTSRRHADDIRAGRGRARGSGNRPSVSVGRAFSSTRPPPSGVRQRLRRDRRGRLGAPFWTAGDSGGGGRPRRGGPGGGGGDDPARHCLGRGVFVIWGAADVASGL